MEETATPQLYDLVFPPGTPRSIIRDIINQFDVQLIDAPERLTFANMDGDVRNLIAARGTKDTMIAVEKYFKEKIKEFNTADRFYVDTVDVYTTRILQFQTLEAYTEFESRLNL